MSIQFNSNKNHEILKELINNSLSEEYGSKTSLMWNKDYDKAIKETMNYVESNVSKDILKTMSEEEYLFLMNKKVYNIIKPIIEENIKKENTNKSNNYKNDKFYNSYDSYGKVGENNLHENEMMQKEYQRLKNQEQKNKDKKKITFSVDNANNIIRPGEDTNREFINKQKRIDPLFDPELMKNYEKIPVIEYPQFSENTKLNESNLDGKMLDYNTIRNEINPRPNFKSSFETKKVEKEKDSEELMKSYNAKLKEYENQIMAINNFDEGQRNMNKKIENNLDKIKPYESLEENLFNNNEKNNINNTNNGFNEIKPTNDLLIGSEFFQNKNNKHIRKEKKELLEEPSEFLIHKENNRNIVLPKTIKTFEYNEIKEKNDEPQKIYSDLFEKEIIPIKDNILMNEKNNLERLNNNNNLDFGPYNNRSLSSFILPPKINNVEKRYRFQINSLDRNKALYPDQNKFEIKFNPASSSYVINQYVDSNGKLIYSGRTIVTGDNDGAQIPITFDNIKQVSLLSIVSPVITFYKGGRSPVIYNSARPATGESADDFSQFNPISTISTGIAQGVFKEPCLYMVIPELEHCFYATDEIGNKAFSKLIPDYGSNSGFINIYTSTFTKLTPDDRADFFRYDPTSNGKIDKITPTIYNFRGQEYDFGIDKLYIDSFEKSTLRYSGYCGDEYETTNFIILNQSDEYEYYCSKFSVFRENCNKLNSTPLVPGDLVYFYNTLPQEQDIIFLEEYIEVFDIDFVDTDTVKLTAGYIENSEQINIIFKNFIPGGNTNTFNIYNQYYIAISQKVPGHVGLKIYYFRITGFSGDSVLLKRTNVFNNKIKKNLIKKIGFVKNNPQGLQSEDPKSIFYKNGFYIYRVGTFVNANQITSEKVNQFKISSEIPWLYLKQYFESIADDYEYQSGDIFILQHKLQLTYELEVTVDAKNSDNLNSNIQGTGINF